MPQVFLSYSSIDAKWVDDFEKALRIELQSRDPNLTIWRDRNKLRAGDFWDQEVEAALRQSGFLCVVASGAWAQSEPCRRELSVFLEDAANRTRIACAVTAAGQGMLDDEVLRRHHTKFYREVRGRNQDYAATTETYRQRVAAMAQDIVEKLKTTPAPGLDQAAGEVRTRVSAEIRTLCGTMRILSMPAPVPIDGIYTDVNILEKRPAHQVLETEDLSRDAAERFGLGRIKHERVPAKEALERSSTLMLLGQPGAGKTTFLKRIAIECLNGTFRPEKVPVFVPLKQFSERTPPISLPDYVRARWAHRQTEELLNEGRALMLLDGLDEVPDVHFARIRDGIDQFTAEYPRCPVVLTCRIAAQKYVFPRFTEVEIANFTREQMLAFATKWFDGKGMPEKIGPFHRKLEDKAIGELASSPLLLTLLCLLFEERPNFEGDRAELYRKAFEVLLEKWDGTRGNQRLNPYRGLGVDEKENLLSEIAYHRFVNNEYLFRQASLEGQIREFFAARPRLVDPETKVDPEVVLDSIESQHGLLIRRSQDYYSFSHLTFQEFLAARQIQSDPTLWSEVAPRITETRWREVLVLTATMGKPEYAIKAMKAHVDSLVSDQDEIQTLLGWCQRKGESTRGGPGVTSRRFFYLGLSRALAQDTAPVLARTLAGSPRVTPAELAFDFNEVLLQTFWDHALAFSVNGDRSLERVWALTLDCDLLFALALSHHRAATHERALVLVFDRAFASAPDRRLKPAFDAAIRLALDFALHRALARAAGMASSEKPALAMELERLMASLPAQTDQELQKTKNWWAGEGSRWAESLRAAMIQHRDIGHHTDLAPRHQSILHQYETANRLLLQCMHAARSLTQKTRDWVEATLCLPASEIAKIPPPR
jgi:hypothetical protein